jgi:hypothetical protein
MFYTNYVIVVASLTEELLREPLYKDIEGESMKLFARLL